MHKPSSRNSGQPILSKFGGIALPGGVTLNGRDMMNDAVQEIKDLEEQLQTTHQLPIDFIVG
jgi:hypothetical protein